MKTFKPVNDVLDAKADRKARQAFYTTLRLVEKMVEWADIYPSARTLEPSAGDGRIVHEMMKAGASVDACETDDEMAVRLKSMGANLVGRDFLAFKPSAPYDRIVMNPPFSRGIWKKHIEHAASMLAPGGRIICIVPNRSSDEFVHEAVNMAACDYVTCEHLGNDWFKDYGTGIAVEVVEANSPNGPARQVSGFFNHQTFNIAVGLESDFRAMGVMPLSPTIDDVKELARTYLDGNSSFYGVNWQEVAEHLKR